MISSEEARIMLLEQKNDDFHQTLNRIEQRLDNLESEGKTHHRWTMTGIV